MSLYEPWPNGAEQWSEGVVRSFGFERRAACWGGREEFEHLRWFLPPEAFVWPKRVKTLERKPGGSQTPFEEVQCDLKVLGLGELWFKNTQLSVIGCEKELVILSWTEHLALTPR